MLDVRLFAQLQLYNNEMETQEKKQERKNLYISYVLSKAHGMLDEEELIKEASKKFDEKNLLDKTV